MSNPVTAWFKDLWIYLRSFAKHWFTLMSGGASVPFAIAGAYVDGAVLKVILLVTALLCFVIATYTVWRPLKISNRSLRKQLKPKLKLSFSESIPGCKVPTRIDVLPFVTGVGAQSSVSTSGVTLSTQTAYVSATPMDYATPKRVVPKVEASLSVTYYRVKIEPATKVSVQNCHAFIEKIERDGVVVFEGGNIPLTFEGAEEIDSNVREIQGEDYIDVFFVSHGNEVSLKPWKDKHPNSVDWDAIFAKHGKYRFHVRVTSASKPERIIISLDWTGDWKTAHAS